MIHPHRVDGDLPPDLAKPRRSGRIVVAVATVIAVAALGTALTMLAYALTLN